MEKLVKFKNDFVSILSLFTSFSTLICCALPSLLVVLGMGAVVAGVVSNVPVLVTLSQHKEWTFLVAGLMIGLNFWLFYGRRQKQAACEIGEDGSEAACDTAARWSKVILWISAGLYLAGLFMAYLLFPLIQWLDL